MIEYNNAKPIMIKDLGMIFPNDKSTYKKRYGLYVCECGNEFKSQTQSIKNGRTSSCGCYQKKTARDRLIKHGESNSRIYSTWLTMWQRCTNKNLKHYKNYGGRGITVCDEWNEFDSFYKWSVANGYDDLLTIDRKDNDKGYSPDNCRWVTRTIQARNTRILQSNNTTGYRGVTFHKRNKKFLSRIRVDSKTIELGYFDEAIEGAIAYNNYVIKNNLEHTLNKTKEGE